MKYLASIFLLSLLAVNARAQITLTEQDFLSISTQPQTNYDSQDTTGARALENLSGAAVTWDFSGRVYTASQSTPSTILTYPGGAALASDTDFTSATNVVKSVDSAGIISYSFVKLDATGLWELGESRDSLGKLSKVAAYKPGLQVFAFPLTYGTTWQSTSSINLAGLPPGAVASESVDATVDGYGTLVSGTKSNQALRIRHKTTAGYSVTIGGFKYSSMTTTYSFDWYTKGAYNASISSDSAFRPNNVSYSTPSSNFVGNQLVGQPDPFSITLSNNPASNLETKLSYNLKDGGPIQIELMDQLGRSVRMLQNGRGSAGQNVIGIDPRSFEPGTYFIRVEAPGVSEMQKLVITR